MPLSYLDDAGYSAGMNRDTSSWLLPSGSTYDQLNVINDIPGVARQRGGTTALGSTANAFVTSIGWAYSDDATPIEELYGANGKTGAVFSINKSTGAGTSLGTPFTANSTIGRPAHHFGFCVFPGGPSVLAITCGQTTSTTFTSSGTTTITAANPQITLGGADTTTNIKVGAYVTGITAGTVYAGRVVSVDTSTKFSVWPVPTISLAPTAGSFTALPVAGGAANTNGGTCTTSFQNRLLLGNTFDMAANKSTSAVSKADRRVNYGVLPTETGINVTQVYSGAAGMLFAPGWPTLNYIEVPGSQPFVAMEPISDGELLILSRTEVIIFQGNLITELSTTSQSTTFDLFPLGVTEGCLSDLSVQRTPVGIMWAGSEGVYAYWPPLRKSPAKTGIRNLCEGKILKYWMSLVGYSDFTIHGAAYARDHYFISGLANGATWALACNLNGNQWTRLSGAGTDIFNGVRRPSTPGQTYAARFWTQSGTAPSMTNGQIVRVETMLDQYAAGTTKTDSDGSAVALSLSTRTITGDAETQKLFQRGTVRHAQASTTAAVTVTAQSTIDAADIDASRTVALGSLSNTSTLTVTGATNAQPIVITTSAAHGLQDSDFVDINGVLGNVNANGRNRIIVASPTTFSLIGIPGSGAYTSGGKVKKMTETDYAMSNLNSGPGVSFTFAGSPNNWELHGVRAAVLERVPVLSS